MRDVLPELLAAVADGSSVALASVVSTRGSAPRRPGAAMLVRANGTVVGSVSGGCVEGATYDVAGEVLTTSVPVLQEFGYADDAGIAVGLTCGGSVEIFIEPVSAATFPELGAVAEDLAAGRPVAVATLIEHPNPERVGHRVVVGPDGHDGSLGSDRFDAAVADDVRGLLESGVSTVLSYGPEGERLEAGSRVFVVSHQPPPRMLVFGAIDFAAALAEQGALLGYEVTVCDARAVFATAERFPAASDVVVQWPHRYLAAEVERAAVDRRTVVCVLTHDAKFDVPLLDLALRLDGAARPAFVGAMGSRTTHEKRLAALRESGLDDHHLARLSSPIGLDLGGRTPQETALSIAAEIVARRWGGTGLALRDLDAPVHR